MAVFRVGWLDFLPRFIQSLQTECRNVEPASSTSRPVEDAPVGADERFIFFRRLVGEPGPKDVKVPAGSSQKKNVIFSLRIRAPV